MTFEELKHALMNYQKFYEWWSINTLRIEAIIHDQEGVKGTSFIRSADVVSDRTSFVLDCILRKDRLIQSNKFYEGRINEVLKFIDSLKEPHRQMVIDKYIKRMHYTDLEQKYNYERRQIHRIIDGLIEKYISSKHVP